MSDLLELEHEYVPHPNRQPGFSAYDLVKVGFFLFGFPKNDEDLWMDFPERDRMLDKLIALKQVYRDFIVLPDRAFELMKSENCKAVTDNCLFSKKSFAFGPQGEKKEKCMMGPKADCDRCGCVVPFYMASLVDRRRIVRDNGRDPARWLARKVDTVAAWIS